MIKTYNHLPFASLHEVTVYGERWRPRDLSFVESENDTASARCTLLQSGGGQLSRGVGVRLWIDGIAIGTWAGRDSEALSMIHLDLRLFVGRYMQIELMDRGQGEWGHLLVDDVWLSQHIRSARERSQYEESSLKK